MKKRFIIIREFLKYISDDDICIFSGKSLCEEAYCVDRANNIYIEFDNIAMPFGVGLSLNTLKKIYVFVNDSNFFNMFDSVAQMSLSKQKNLIIVVLRDGCFQEVGNQTSITDSLTSIKSAVFNMGAIVHDLTKHFNDSKNKGLPILLSSLAGPAVIFIDVNRGLNKKGVTTIDKSILIDRLKLI